MKRFAAVAAILVIFTAGCAGGFIKSKVESGIRNALPQYIGPAKSYTVRADGSGEGMLRGLIRHLHIEGDDVQLEPKLIVSRLTVDMDEVRYHTNTRQLKSIKSTDFTATLLEDAVNHYVAEGTTDQYKLRVKLAPGEMRVDFVPTFLGGKSPVSIFGKPEIVGGKKVNFVANKASIANLPLPKLVVNKMLEGVNPILDMSRMKLPLTLSGITIADGSLAINGHAEFKPGETIQKPRN